MDAASQSFPVCILTTKSHHYISAMHVKSIQFEVPRETSPQSIGSAHNDSTALKTMLWRSGDKCILSNSEA